METRLNTLCNNSLPCMHRHLLAPISSGTTYHNSQRDLNRKVQRVSVMESEATCYPSRPSNIYIVGAQCTGKTTLVKALKAHFNDHESCTWRGEPTPQPLILIEVARGVLQKHAFTADDITTSPIKAFEMQRLMLEAQLEAEKAAGDQWFISDRSGFDPIVYARRYAGEDAAQTLLASSTFLTLEQNMKESLMVVCEAGADWLFDDGVRLMPTSKEDWVDFHKLFCVSLDANGITYVVLPYSMTDSRERADYVLGKWKAGHTQERKHNV